MKKSKSQPAFRPRVYEKHRRTCEYRTGLHACPRFVTPHGASAHLLPTNSTFSGIDPFGNERKLVGSKHDLLTLAEKVAAGSIKPRLYQCCGAQDFLYTDDVRFRDAIRKLPLELTYEAGPGENERGYWDKMIQHVLAWMFPANS